MTTTTFDPLHVAKELADGGFPEEQANTLARVWAAEDARRRAADAERDEELVTQKDLALALARQDVRQLKWGFAYVVTHLGAMYAMLRTLLPAA